MALADLVELAWCMAGVLRECAGFCREGHGRSAAWVPRVELTVCASAREGGGLSAAFINIVFLFSLSLLNSFNFSSPSVRQ